jgi:pimeloyl-ACP methyl ester carboxylesterase
MTVLLHGFWGGPQDWNQVLAKIPLGHEVLVPDLYERGPLSPEHDLTAWTKNFLGWLDHFAGAGPINLVGYSMGARLGLNALIAQPERFARALLMSGAAFISDEDRQARAVWEQLWCERFESQPWRELETAWQEQAVFSGSDSFGRRHSELLRELLPLSMTKWSVLNHPFQKEHVQRLGPQVEWAFGALDQKYLEMAKTLQELPVRGQITVIPNAGHRLISDAVDFAAAWIERRT